MKIYRYLVKVEGGPENDPWEGVREITAGSLPEADFKLEQRLQEVGRYTPCLLGVRQVVTEEIPPDPRIEVLHELETTALGLRDNSGLPVADQDMGHVLVDLFRTTRERLEQADE